MLVYYGTADQNSSNSWSKVALKGFQYYVQNSTLCCANITYLSKKKKLRRKVLDLLLKKIYIFILFTCYWLRIFSYVYCRQRSGNLLFIYFYASCSQLAALLILTFVERKYICFVRPVRDATFNTCLWKVLLLFLFRQQSINIVFIVQLQLDSVSQFLYSILLWWEWI